MKKIKSGLFFSVLIAMVGLMIIAPVMPPLIRELGLSELHSGLIISLGSVAMAAMSPLWGMWSDRLGRRRIMLVGFAGMLVSYALFTFIMYSGLKSWVSGGLLVVLLVAARTLIGGFIPAVPASAQAYMADVTDEQSRSGGMALLGAANGLGLVLGPAIAGVFTIIGLIWPLYIGIVLPMLAFVCVLLFVPERRPVRQRGQAKPPRINPFQRGLAIYMLACITVMLCIVSLQVVGGFYFQDQLQLTTMETARYVSIGLMICGVSMIAMQAILMKKLQLKPQQQLLWGAILLIVSLVIQLTLAHLAFYYAAYLLFGVGAGLMMPGFMTGASLAVSSEQQGGVAGLIGMVQGIAAMIAPLLSTGLYRVDIHLPYCFAAVLLIALSAILILQKQSTERNSKNQGKVQL